MNTLKTLIIALVLGSALPGTMPIALAQGQGSSNALASTRPIEPQEFLRLAFSSSILQGQAAKLAADRETRPEVKSYATAASEFRQALLHRIEAFAAERGMQLPTVKEFEHQVIIENLEPLDYLALSRRYAEIQVQALKQEIGIYQAASRSPHEEIKEFAAQVLPGLQQRLEDAQTMYDAIKP